LRLRIEIVAGGSILIAHSIADVEDVPLTYLPGNATRIRVKAAGGLALVQRA
jgi:hypothetical protein